MEEDIKNSIELLVDNGYIVKKWNKRMDEDADACSNDEEMFCGDCACHICAAGFDI